MNNPIMAATPRGNSLPSMALRDWVRAFGLWRLWTALGREDLADRYRRTIFGASWIITSFALFVFVKVVIFGQMTSVAFGEFAMFVTLGFGLWAFINSMVLDCCTVYTASSNWLLGTAIPYPVFFLQAIYRNWLIFLMILVVMIAALLWQQRHWTPVMLTALPGLLVYVVTPVWVAAILAPLCARFRDVNHAIQTVMRMLFFVTPIIWMPEQSPQLAMIARYNVFTHFIEIVRQPLIYGTIPHESWLIVLLVSAIGLPAGFAAYALTRNRIAYWL